LTDYQNSCTIGLDGKRVMKQSLKIPPHLKRYLVKGKCQETSDYLNRQQR